MLILKGSGAGIMQLQCAWRTPHPRFFAAAVTGALMHADPEEVRYWKEVEQEELIVLVPAAAAATAAAATGALVHADPEEVRYWKEVEQEELIVEEGEDDSSDDEQQQQQQQQGEEDQ
jgi:hypothetical protein